MTKLYSFFIGFVLWIGLGFFDASFAQSSLVFNQDVPQEYCSVTPSGQRFCEAVQSQYTKTVGAPIERCITSVQGRVTCEWQSAPVQSCIVLSSGRDICSEVKAVESPLGNENMICTDTPQGRSCVSRTPPSISSCALVRCAQGHRCIESTTGPQCVPFEERTLTCANALCSVGRKCIETATGPQCVSDQPNFTPWDSTICAAIYDPVCGQKGNLKRTFGNDCEARRDNYNVLYKGECRFAPPTSEPPQACPFIYAPVCGQKGSETRNFSNDCTAKSAGFSVKHQGQCRPRIDTPPATPEPVMCPRIYRPVCGQKGFVRKTFGNSCEAKADSYSVIYEGRCQ